MTGSTRENLPMKEWRIIEVSQNGIFLGDTIMGSDATQKYKQVQAGDIVYNPYRVNIGSIGVVPAWLDGALTSPAYVVFRSTSPEFPPSYIVAILKHPRYLRVISNYSLSSARANLPFSELIRIAIPKPDDAILETLLDSDEKWHYHTQELAGVNQDLQHHVDAQFRISANQHTP